MKKQNDLFMLNQPLREPDKYARDMFENRLVPVNMRINNKRNLVTIIKPEESTGARNN